LQNPLVNGYAIKNRSREKRSDEKTGESNMFHQSLRSFLLLLFPVAVVLTACSAPISGPSVTPTPHMAQGKVGEPLPVGATWVITLNSATISSGDSSYTPAAGKVLLIFSLSQRNRSSQQAQTNGAADWSLRANGNTFAVVKTAYGELPVGSVQPAETSEGDLVYEVPESIHRFTLTFMQGDNQATWDIAV
jgi:hypothetical protein